MEVKKNKMKGFTLVELLAVIVILAIILVIAVPLNTLSPIVTNWLFSPKLTLFKLLHPSKADVFIVVTLAGIDIFSKASQP